MNFIFASIFLFPSLSSFFCCLTCRICYKIDARTALGTTRDYFNKYYYLYELCAVLCCYTIVAWCTLHRPIFVCELQTFYIKEINCPHYNCFFFLFSFLFLFFRFYFLFFSLPILPCHRKFGSISLCWLLIHDSKLLLLHTKSQLSICVQ